MAERRADAVPGGPARNIGLLIRRLRRRRVPHTAGTPDRSLSILAIFGLVALVLVAVSLAFLDDGAVGWGRRLPGWARAFFRAITRFGKSDWLLIPSAVVGAYVLLASWTAVSKRMAAAWAEIGALILYFFVAVGGAGLVTNLTKFIIGRSRPELFATDGAMTFTPFAWSSSHTSFPSGHATTIAAAAVALILMMRHTRFVATFVVLVAGAIVVSRVVVRAHFPSDVVAGIFVGATFAWALAVWLGRRGVAFQGQADGRLVASTVAIRGVARRAGIPAIPGGLADAVFALWPGSRAR